MTTLTIFDKVNLAACAVRRAQDQYAGGRFDSDRFQREFETVRLWKGHNVYHTELAGQPYAYVMQG
jgi:hypothetical protein